MLINNRFTYDPVADLLGTGGFGKVYKAHDGMLQRTVVLKMVQKSKIHDRYDLVNEIRRIINYRHLNLVEFYDVFANPITDASGAPDELQVGVMEYINGGSLKELIGQKLNTHTVEDLLKGVLRGLAYLHQNGIIHRDIKPANILIQKTQSGDLIAKITDFNISKLIHSEGSSISSVIGTYEYMSPEQLGKGDGKIGIAADIWSFGAMVYEIFTGAGPFGSRRNGDTDSVIITNILSNNNLDNLENVPDPFREIVLKCLKKNPAERFIDCNQILSCLDDATKVIEERVEGEIEEQKAGNETDDKTILVEKGEVPTKIPEVEPENPKGPILPSERINILDDALVWLAKYWWATLILIVFLICSIIYSSESRQENTSNMIEGIDTVSIPDNTIVIQQNKTNDPSQQSSVLNNKNSTIGVLIGEQEWMINNLDVTNFKNGDPIPEAKTMEEWNRAAKEGRPVWCYFDNDPSTNLKGKLYNWYAVNDPRGLAPIGWKVATVSDWQKLELHLKKGYEKVPFSFIANQLEQYKMDYMSVGVRIANNYYDFAAGTVADNCWWVKSLKSKTIYNSEITIAWNSNNVYFIDDSRIRSVGMPVKCIREGL